MTTQAKPKAYRVTGACINVKTGVLAGVIPGRGGLAVVTLYRGALLPADAPPADVARMLRSGLIEEVPDA